MILVLIDILAQILFFKKSMILNQEFYKKNMLVIISYILIVIMFLVLFSLIFFIGDFFNNSYLLIVEIYVLYKIACTIGCVMVFPIVALLQKIREIRLIKQYEKQYKIESFQYYRDIVGDISPALLSVICDKRIKYTDQLIATILYLNESEKIEINENMDVKILNAPKLRSHERYIVDNLNGKVEKKVFKKTLKEKIFADLRAGGYIQKTDINEFDMTDFMEAISGWLLISLLITSICLVSFSKFSLLLIGAFVINFFIAFQYKRLEYLINPLIRKEKSLELSAKLNGLKRFLLDFTIINDRKIKEIKVLDDYILYAIIFNLKGKLDKESKKVYKKIKRCIKAKNRKLFKLDSDKLFVHFVLFSFWGLIFMLFIPDYVIIHSYIITFGFIGVSIYIYIDQNK